MVWAQLIYIVVMLLLVVYCGVIIFRLLPLIIYVNQTLPFVPISKRGAKLMMQVPELAGKQTIVDLGCGRGTLLAAARKQFPNAELTGVEFKHSLVQQAKLYCYFWKKPAQIIEGDMFAHDITHYDAIIGWWIPQFTEKLMVKFAQEAKPGCVIVSFMFPLPQHSAFTMRAITIGKEKLFVYTKR